MDHPTACPCRACRLRRLSGEADAANPDPATATYFDGYDYGDGDAAEAGATDADTGNCDGDTCDGDGNGYPATIAHRYLDAHRDGHSLTWRPSGACGRYAVGDCLH